VKTPGDSSVRPKLIVLDLLKYLRVSEIFKLLLRSTASLQHFYLLSCSLATLPVVDLCKLGGDEMRWMSQKDVELVYNQLPELGYDDKRELLSRILFFNKGFNRCFTVKEKGALAYMQWLVFPSENEQLKRVYGSRFLPLRENQVMIENAFTFPAFRGRGFFPYVTVQILKEAKQQGYSTAVTYVKKENFKALTHFVQLGFKINRLVPEYKLFGRAWRAW
jgi:hypothetical protein